MLALVDGALMASEDAGRHWQPRVAGCRRRSTRSRSIRRRRTGCGLPARTGSGAATTSAATWRAVGQPLPEPGTQVRGIAADPAATTLVVTTHRGMYRSADGGQSWALKEGNLPIHLEAGPLIRDPVDARTLYAVYSLMPYPEVWRTALEGSNLLARADPVSLAGAGAFVLLLMIGGAPAGPLAGAPAHRTSAAGRPVP